MFSNLMASAPKRTGFRAAPAWGVSVLVHALGAFLFATGAARLSTRGDEVVFDRVSYVDISQEPPPEPEPEVEDTPAPAQPAPAEVTEPDLPAGYQVLAVPDEVVGIPAPGLVEFRAEDFTGRGIAGGVGGGRPLHLAPTPARAPEPEPVLSVAVVDEPPRIVNALEISSRMEELYPMHLRLARVSGEVVIQLVVDAKGNVEPKGDTIVSATNRELVLPTRALARVVRFEPARRNGNPVRVWVRLPVSWKAD
jgi:protein TonB